MSRTRRAIGWTFVTISLLMHVLTVLCYAAQPDSMAAFTVLPIWVWGGIGLAFSFIAFGLLKAPLSLVVTAIWVVTLSVAMDEARVLSNLGSPKIEAERTKEVDGKRVLRVATLNCASFRMGDPTEDLKKWDPDIVLIQEVYPHLVRQIAEKLYDGRGDYKAYLTNGVVTRFEIRREVRNPLIRSQQVTVRFPGGRDVEVVNVHLATAATDLRIWDRSSRAAHSRNRSLRRKELSTILQGLEQTSPFPATPTILGGDFNSSATDVVHRQLVRDFEDSFEKVGRGWGNTFHRRFPVLRIDCLYATPQFRPQSCGVAVTRHSDHRMVVCDYVLWE